MSSWWWLFAQIMVQTRISSHMIAAIPAHKMHTIKIGRMLSRVLGSKGLFYKPWGTVNRLVSQVIYEIKPKLRDELLSIPYGSRCRRVL